MKVFVILLSVFALTLGYVKPRISDRIYGGHPTTIDKHPYQVSLMYKQENNSSFCGGSIINKDTIVTAAHCVHGLNQDYFTLKVGSTYYDKGVKYEIAKIIVHPEYTLGAKYDNDIAVIKLAKPLIFSDKVQPIELRPAGSPVPEGTIAQATGWGGTMVGSKDLAPQLHEVDLAVISIENCQTFYKDKVTSSMLCTHSPGKGTYHGDSGGPLVCNNTLIGVTSWSNNGTSEFPDGFSDVSALNGFLTKNL